MASWDRRIFLHSSRLGELGIEHVNLVVCAVGRIEKSCTVEVPTANPLYTA